MSEYREFLLTALRRVIDGGDIGNDELDAEIPAAETLKGAEREAYHGLSYWADDGDIRAKKLKYGPMRREGLNRLLDRLITEPD
jgi:hypothetical protein